ncbi:MAG: Xaa-Pro peptidase family protein [Acidobacteriales bacterium]|nr:Xaa-Pro peptidase family protein [Terriglobales bacterium]
MNYRQRFEKLRAALSERKLEALLVTHMPNIRYLCGFTGSSGALLVFKDSAIFFTDGRYTEQAKAEVKQARLRIAKGSPWMAVAKAAGAGRGRRLGFEAERVPVALWKQISAALPRGWRLQATSGLIERLRMVKEPAEIDLIRQAVRLGSQLFQATISSIKPGVGEAAVAAKLEYAARKSGVDGMSFPTIVAGGKRSALPHGRASAAALPANGFVLVDFGVILAGYCSDMTRTVHLGKPSKRAQQHYQAVLEAQLRAIETVRAGVAASQVDGAARCVLGRAGLGRFFTHSCGHGLGLEIHEPPRLGKGQQEPLESGMVITVEPGAYIAEQGGVRIEDVVVVTERGCEVLTPTTKELIAL